MTIRVYAGKVPEIANSAYVDESAVVIGDVKIGEDSSIWPMTVVRGDVHSITIGKGTNIQDASVLHVTHDGKFSPGGFPLVVGNNVTVGHRVTLHACTVGDYCLIGMSATIMDGAVLGDRLIIGAGSLVPTGKVLEGGYLYVGSPVKRVRKLNEKEIEFLDYSASHYVKLKNHYKNPERLE
ncbi:MAG: gamma carbonic anhydrase family protein [Gammaproteobacteria bacterium RIFCSPLOWO2_12_47_11]|nr:MAG: gamma carbonic anhydrase family protein [Gammaproteobacteria bacterium RIFCSPLOWO2_12_47_11]